MKSGSMVVVAAVCGGLLIAHAGWAHEGHDHAAEAQRQAAARLGGQMTADMHSERRGNYTRSVRAFQIPDVMLVNADMRRVPLRNLLMTDGPVMLDFVSMDCEPKCSQMNEVFSDVAGKLSAGDRKPRLISIVVDGERPVAGGLGNYPRRAGGARSQVLTGSRQDIELLQHAFDSEGAGSPGAEPITLVRAGGGRPWLRIEGLATAEELTREIDELVRK